MAAEIDVKVIRMLSPRGCVELFWEELQIARETDPNITRETVFDRLNEHYRIITGDFRYKDYDSFRKILQKYD